MLQSQLIEANSGHYLWWLLKCLDVQTIWGGCSCLVTILTYDNLIRRSFHGPHLNVLFDSWLQLPLIISFSSTPFLGRQARMQQLESHGLTLNWSRLYLCHLKGTHLYTLKFSANIIFKNRPCKRKKNWK